MAESLYTPDNGVDGFIECQHILKAAVVVDYKVKRRMRDGVLPYSEGDSVGGRLRRMNNRGRAGDRGELGSVAKAVLDIQYEIGLQPSL